MKKIISSNTTKAILRVLCMFIIIIAITSIKAHAQITDPGSDPDSAPIDGGLSLLIAGGVGYGIKKVRERRKPPTPKGE